MGPVGIVVAAVVGALAGLTVGPAADRIASVRYAPGAAGHDPDDLALALADAPTSARMRVVAVVLLAAAGGLLGAEFDHAEIALFFGVLTFVYVVAAVIDLQYLRLPDVLMWPAIGLAVAGSFALAARYDRDDAALWGLVGGVGATAFLWFFSGLFRLLRGKEAFGLGDLKLMLSLGPSVGWLGWTEAAPVFGPVGAVVWSTMAGFLIGSLAGLPAAGFKISKHVPFGPFLMVGWFVVVLFADTLRG